MKFSLIIPTYNEQDVIAATLFALSACFDKTFKKDEWEIIVADNASSDRTRDVVLALGKKDARIKLLSLIEKGKGRALRAGFASATGDIVGFTDADLSISPEAIADAITALEKGEERALYGSRFHPRSVMPGREWWRVGSSQIFNLFARALLAIRASDTQCPLKLMKRDLLPVFLATKEDTWFFDLEFIALAEQLGVPMLEVPVVWDEHRYPLRQSKLAPLDGLRAIVAMLRIRKRLPEQLLQFQKTR